MSTGKLCKYFFTQLFVTYLLLIVFESNTADPQFQLVKTFITYECALIVIELLFYLCRVASKLNYRSFDPDTSFARMDNTDKYTYGMAIFFYVLQNCWLIYGNVLFTQLPTTNKQGVKWSQLKPGVDDPEELSDKWLYYSMQMLVLYSYFHLFVFVIIVSVLIFYAVLKWTRSHEQMQRMSFMHPFRLWLFADDGIFASMDTVDERDDDDFQISRAHEDRVLDTAMSEIQKQLALQHLKAKSFNETRKETIDNIKKGEVKGNLTSFGSAYPSYGTPTGQDYRSSSFKRSFKAEDGPDGQASQTRCKRLPRLDCAICQEVFTEDTPVVQMPCHIKHIFHSACIRDWLQRQSICPLCKQVYKVPEEELPDREELRLQLRQMMIERLLD